MSYLPRTCIKIDVFPLRKSRTNCRKSDIFINCVLSVRRSSAWWFSCHLLSSQSDLRPDWGCFISPPAWVKSDQTSLLARCCFTVRHTRCRWHESEAAASPPAHSRLTVSIQSRGCANEKVCGGKIRPSLLAGLWSVLFFQVQVGPDIFSLCICAGSGLSYPLHLHIKAHFFISIKGLNGNFPAKQKSNVPLFVAFWRCICCPSAFLHKDAS